MGFENCKISIEPIFVTVVCESVGRNRLLRRLEESPLLLGQESFGSKRRLDLSKGLQHLLNIAFGDLSQPGLRELDPRT